MYTYIYVCIYIYTYAYTYNCVCVCDRAHANPARPAPQQNLRGRLPAPGATTEGWCAQQGTWGSHVYTHTHMYTRQHTFKYLYVHRVYICMYIYRHFNAHAKGAITQGWCAQNGTWGSHIYTHTHICTHVNTHSDIHMYIVRINVYCVYICMYVYRHLNAHAQGATTQGLCAQNGTGVAKMQRMPYLYKSFSSKEPHD